MLSLLNYKHLMMQANNEGCLDESNFTLAQCTRSRQITYVFKRYSQISTRRLSVSNTFYSVWKVAYYKYVYLVRLYLKNLRFCISSFDFGSFKYFYTSHMTRTTRKRISSWNLILFSFIFFLNTEREHMRLGIRAKLTSFFEHAYISAPIYI